MKYVTAISRCEADARTLGHSLDVWYQVDEHLHACLCEFCSELVWITRLGDEKHWRIGGSALKQDCLEADWRLASEA